MAHTALAKIAALFQMPVYQTIPHFQVFSDRREHAHFDRDK